MNVFYTSYHHIEKRFYQEINAVSNILITSMYKCKILRPILSMIMGYEKKSIKDCSFPYHLAFHFNSSEYIYAFVFVFISHLCFLCSET